jgi:hypothetical protein
VYLCICVSDVFYIFGKNEKKKQVIAFTFQIIFSCKTIFYQTINYLQKRGSRSINNKKIANYSPGFQV